MDPFIQTAVLLKSQLYQSFISKIYLKNQPTLWQVDIFFKLTYIVFFFLISETDVYFLEFLRSFKNISTHLV